MNRKQPLPNSVRGGRPGKATKRAWEHGTPMPAARTPGTTRGRSISRDLQRQPRSKPAQKTPPSNRSAKTRAGRTSR